MGLDGAERDHEALGDLGVGRARRDERENLGLTRGQCQASPGGRPPGTQLTVTEALTLFGGLYPGRQRIGEVLDAIDMADDARTRIGALSGGQRRRVDLGIAIVGQPEMLFLDEPTTGLDPEARRRLGRSSRTSPRAGPRSC